MTASREWFEKDYYKVLGVPETASAKEITKAYRKLARENHPDAKPGDAAAEDRFKDVSAAYDVLNDEAKRKEYDEVRRLGPMAGGFGGRGPGPGGFSFDAGEAGLGDLLGGLFGGRQRGGRSGGVGPQRGADVEASLSLSFEDAAQGLETTLYLTSDVQCGTCSGTGARPGTSARVCGVCGGRGVTNDNQGMFAFSSPCRACQGNGTIVEHACGNCRGAGVEQRPREVKTRIPAGVADGQRIRLKGRGAPGRNGGPAGDLIVECRVAPHARFGRDGLNLTTRVAVSFAEAALGADVSVPTLLGAPVTMRVRPGTQPGTRQRIKGKGIAGGRESGDLIVTVDVVVPTTLTDEQQAAIEAMARVVPPPPR